MINDRVYNIKHYTMFKVQEDHFIFLSYGDNYLLKWFLGIHWLFWPIVGYNSSNGGLRARTEGSKTFFQVLKVFELLRFDLKGFHSIYQSLNII